MLSYIVSWHDIVLTWVKPAVISRALSTLQHELSQLQSQEHLVTQCYIIAFSNYNNEWKKEKNKHIQKLIVKVTIEQIYLYFFFREAFSSYAASIGSRH